MTIKEEDRELLARFVKLHAENVGMPYFESTAITLSRLVREAEAAALTRARDDALEEAAKVAEGFSDTTGPIAVCRTISDRIRSLKKQGEI